MRFRSLIGAVAATFIASSAHSADIGSVFLPAFSWSGLYLGANAGYGFAQGAVSSEDGGFFADDNNSLARTIEFESEGFLAGAQVGYNWTFEELLFGIEAEAGYLAVEGDKFDLTQGIDDFGITEFGAYGLVAARFGITVGRTLLYTKGGLAIAEVNTQAGDLDEAQADITVTDADATELDDVLVGYAIGGGIEHAFTRNWSVKVEYLFMDFDQENSDNDQGNVFTHDNEIQTVKVGVNYLFGQKNDPLK